MLINAPIAPEKNVPTIVYIDLEALMLHPKVSGDSYFSDLINLDFVLAVYESDVGSQKEIVRFRISGAQTHGTFDVSEYARGSFLLKRIILCDRDGGTLTIERADLPAGLDITV